MNKNIITGIVVVVALVAFFFGLNFLKGKNIFDKDNTFYAQYDNVDGLKGASKVLLRGKKIGEVLSVDFTNERAETLQVSFSISDKYKIPKGTVAQIISEDIMGSRALELRFPSSVGNGYLTDGDTLNGGVSKGLKDEVSAQVLPLKAKAEELMLSVDSLLTATRAVLGKDSQTNLIATIESMKNTFRNLESTTGRLNQVVTGEQKSMETILHNFASISSNLEQNNEEITAILGNVSAFTDTLSNSDFAGTLVEAQQAIKQLSAMMNKIDKGEGTVGALLNDDDLYQNLENATANMNRLMTDFRMNPKKYVHFSLLKTGRTVYTDSPKPTNNEDVFYRIKIFHSSAPIALSNPIFKGRKDVEEVKLRKKGGYLYTIGHSSSYNTLERMLRKVQKDFPDAYIIEDKR